jgi:hypothetical protein
MPYLTIEYPRSWTSPGPKGVARIFREGVHEVSDEIAQQARDVAPAFVKITDAPQVQKDLHRSGVLTKEEIQLGSELADEKKRGDALAAEVERLSAKVEPDVDPETIELPFSCHHCDTAFPTEAARDRHEEMNHVEDEEPDEEPAAEPVAEDPKPAPARRRTTKKVT